MRRVLLIFLLLTTANVRASERPNLLVLVADDLRPDAIAALGVPLPDRPIDGIDLMPLLLAKNKLRPSPLFFWDFDIANLKKHPTEPWLDPDLQKGTTPLVKKMNGIATRNFENRRVPADLPGATRGPRSVIEGDWKLVVQETRKDETKREPFDLATDPAEKKDLSADQPDRVTAMEKTLADWQQSVLQSLQGADYRD